MPQAAGRITYRKKDSGTYVEYLIENIYDPAVQYARPKRKAIEKLSEGAPGMMQPNENFRRYFPEVEFPEEKEGSRRSSCLRIGAYIVIRKVIEEYHLHEMLGKYFEAKDVGLFLDFVAYTIITEGNAAQYYPDYAYDHPLFTKDMRMYSASRLSDFFRGITDDQSVGFLNDWNGSRDHREKIYISYDPTNKNSQAGDVGIVEFGYPKVDVGQPVFNYSIAYDTDNREPLFYEAYPGSVNDVSQQQFMVSKARGLGYRKIGFILDRGYFSKANIEYMDSCGYSFVIMAKGLADLVRGLILPIKGTFEKKRMNYIHQYHTYGTTVKKKLFGEDRKERYFHIYYRPSKEAAEIEQMEKRLEKMDAFLRKHRNEAIEVGPGISKYYITHYDEKSGALIYHEEKFKVIEAEQALAGYFVIITSEKMTAKDALILYKSRDTSEKMFRSDKSYLRNGSMRTHSDDATVAKIFVEFVALIVRSRIYCRLKDEWKGLESKPDFMTVPAALGELEKIEMVRQLDGKYRLDHAVTKNQKTILKAFGLDVQNIKRGVEEISRELSNV